MRLYFSESGLVYNSLNECLSAEPRTPADLNPSSVIEFLTFGSVYGQKTLVKGVMKKVTHQPYELDSGNGLVESRIRADNSLILKKSLSLQEAKRAILEFFESRSGWLREHTVSIDLTGGIDSRLIASILACLKIPFDVVYSTASGNDDELKIVEHLVGELKADLKIIYPDKNGLTENDLSELIRLGDGQWDPLGLRSLRKTQRWRRNHGYDLAITGVAGELYKDFWWQQDFPFYASKQDNLSRLLNMRMYPALFPEAWLGKFFEETQAEYLERFQFELASHSQQLNSQTYDQIYYHLRIKEQISIFSHASASFLPVWSPLLQPELLTLGYNLRRRDRFFNRFHREVISDCLPEISKIPTTDGGMSVSNHPLHLLNDVATFFKTKSGRLLSRFASRKQKSGASSPSNEDLIPAVEEAILLLKEEQLLSSKAPHKAEHYPNSLWGRIILLGYHLGGLASYESG